MDADEVVLVSSDSSITSSPVFSERQVSSEVICSESTYIAGTSSENVNVPSSKRVYHTLSDSDSDGHNNDNHVTYEAVITEEGRKVQYIKIFRIQ